MTARVALMIALAITAQAGCATTPSTLARTGADCENAPRCRAEGRLSVVEVDHVKMGRLDLPAGGCINVSLPASEIRRLAGGGPRHVTIEGRVYPARADPDLAALEVNGRRIGWSQCGDFYVFVGD